MTETNNLEKIIRNVDDFIQNNDFESAKLWLDELLFDVPDSGKVHAYLAWLYATYFENDSLAELHFKFALKFDANFYGAYINYSLLLVKNRRFAEAEAILKDGLKNTEFEKSDLLETLAKVYEAKGMLQKAKRCIKQALKSSVHPMQCELLLGELKRLHQKQWALFLF